MIEMDEAGHVAQVEAPRAALQNHLLGAGTHAVPVGLVDPFGQPCVPLPTARRARVFRETAHLGPSARVRAPRTSATKGRPKRTRPAKRGCRRDGAFHAIAARMRWCSGNSFHGVECHGGSQLIVAA